MRPVRVSLNAAGYSPWVPIDYISAWFGVSLAVILSEDGNLTYSVQFTLDNPFYNAQDIHDAITISRTTTVATVTDVGPLGLGHGLTTGDSVIIKGSGSSNLDSPYATSALGGTGDVGFNVASTPSTTTFTYTVANSGATADTGNAHVNRLRVFSHATLAAQTTRQNGSLNYPVQAVRLYISSYSAGYADLIVLQGNAR